MTDQDIRDLLLRCGFTAAECAGGELAVRSPVDGRQIAALAAATEDAVASTVARARSAFLQWRQVPAPVRGELVRLWGEELRAAKQSIGQLISLEVGKITSEGLGEVQECIDICDYALGLSRQLWGRTMVSERPGHRLMEQYHPLGVVAVITAFNFPSAVFAWNAAVALVCGDPVIFKPSDKAPLSGLATFKALERAIVRFGARAPEGLAQAPVGGTAVGQALVDSHDVALVSATGSTAMGRAVGSRVAARFGRRILELGGNNAMIVTPAADVDMALRAILFGAVGTAGQRCTTLRRLIVHRSLKAALTERLARAYAGLRIGSPLEEGTLVGPLIDAGAFERMLTALMKAQDQGGRVLQGGRRVLQTEFPSAFYVEPALVDMPAQTSIVREETFAPILYILSYDTLDEAISLQNDVPQGLSSCIFSNDMREVEAFLSASGSDCGIANVNMGPSGAEIGGAFGGEKETGGDRECGTDAWKQYMRRTTNAVNYSTELPLAQGVSFG